MDAFEQLISEILWKEGFWVRPSFKVELTKEEKIRIGRHSSPRWELDIVAYCARNNAVYAIECKSYLDSIGVAASSFDDPESVTAHRYKLFNEPKLRKVVFGRLCKQLIKSGACRRNPKVQFVLACGKIRNEADRKKLHAHFKRKGWQLWDENWIRPRIRKMAEESYENQVASVVAKLMLRS